MTDEMVVAYNRKLRQPFIDSLADVREAVPASSARVCIGLPVFNAAQDAARTIETILAQSFRDFQLIVSDDASTDRTGEVCRAIAAQDSRVAYVRAAVPIGAAVNRCRTFMLGAGQYFHWSRTGREYARDFLARAVELLDDEPTVVLAHPAPSVADRRTSIRLTSNYAQSRFAAVVANRRGEFVQTAMAGVFRRSMADLVPLPERGGNADHVFLARLALYGKIAALPGEIGVRETADGFVEPDGSSRWESLIAQLASTRYGWLSPTQRLACWTSVLGAAVRLSGGGNAHADVQPFDPVEADSKPGTAGVNPDSKPRPSRAAA